MTLSVSVVIPVRDGERYLAEAIASVRAQTLSPLEILVVDDGSQDNSADLARGLADRVLSGPPAGPGAARNRGARAARGQVLAFLDADDRYRRNALANLLSALGQAPAAQAAFGHVVHFLSPDLPPARRRALHLPGPQPAFLPSGGLVSAEAFAALGGFDPRLPAGEFIDWLARLRFAGLAERLIPEVVVERRIHAANLTRSPSFDRTAYVRVAHEALRRRRDAK